MTPIGAINSEKKYKGRLRNTALINVSFPQNERDRAFQEESFEWNWSMIGL